MSVLKIFKSFFASEVRFFLVVAILLFSLSISPQIKRQIDTPKDRVFSGLEFYSDDYSIYVSNVFQGMRGRWTLLDKHTSEPHPGTIIHDEYLLWGKLMGIFKIDAITAYHLARYFFGFILLIIVYQFIKLTYPQSTFKRKLAFFFACFSVGFVIITQSEKGLNFDFHLNWMTELDPFYRFVALPHYLMGNILFLSNLILFNKYSSYNSLRTISRVKLLTAGGLTSLLLALIHPVALVSLIALYGVYLFLTIMLEVLKIVFSNKFKIMDLFQIKNLKFEIFYVFLSLLVSAPVMFFYRSQFFVAPWNHMAAWEGVTQYYIPFKEFVLALGPTFFLAVLGLISFVKNSFFTTNINYKFQTCLPTRQVSNLFSSWILSFFLLFYLSYPYLHISQVRFMQVFFFLPFSILSAEGVMLLIKITSIFLNLIFKNLKLKIYNFYTLALLILILVFIYVPSYYHSLTLKYRFFTDFSPLVYPVKGTVEGYYFLRDNTNPENVVLTAFLAGTQIPYFSNNTVYIGHLWATLNRKEKEALTDKFLTDKMTKDEALAFFRKGRIRYYFHGWQEASYGVYPPKYPFLKPVFQNQQVTIYRADY